MRKIKVYLDTSYINYLVATRLPDKMQDTLALWDILIANELFEVVLSETVGEELQRCYEPKRSQLLEKLAEMEFHFVQETQEITDLADRYAEFGVLSSDDYYDLLHIAHATVSGCKLIVSWNFKHFVNFKTMDLVNAVNLVEGYDPVRIVSPSMLLGEYENE
jgi:predicted nucleic acid-binding protein